jgi:hypothetical protein
VNQERITRDVSIVDLAGRPTSGGLDRKAALCSEVHAALEADDLDVAGDLVALLTRHYDGDPDVAKWARRLAQARARPLLNAICKPNDVVRFVSSEADLLALPLRMQHRAVLLAIDGQLTARALADASGLEPVEYAEALRDLALFGVVDFDRSLRTSRPPSSSHPPRSSAPPPSSSRRLRSTPPRKPE